MVGVRARNGDQMRYRELACTEGVKSISYVIEVQWSETPGNYKIKTLGLLRLLNGTVGLYGFVLLLIRVRDGEA